MKPTPAQRRVMEFVRDNNRKIYASLDWSGSVGVTQSYDGRFTSAMFRALRRNMWIEPVSKERTFPLQYYVLTKEGLKILEPQP